MKTLFCLPYKDRNGKYKKALDAFITPFNLYLKNNLENYEIVIVEQSGSNELFNLGRTINIGFDLLKNELNDYDNYIFHPIDMLPIDTDYNISKTTKFCAEHHSFDGTFYKAIGFKVKDFKNLNGFTNEFWGWGGEDDEMRVRIKIQNIDINTYINKYNMLCSDGNAIDGEENYAPTIHKHWNMVYEFEQHKNLYKSGLNTLDYELKNIEIYSNIKKYIIE